MLDNGRPSSQREIFRDSRFLLCLSDSLSLTHEVALSLRPYQRDEFTQTSFSLAPCI